MPDWITTLLDIASWPVRHFAEQNGYDQTGWQYLAAVFILYMLQAVILAWMWYDFWFHLPSLARRIGKWATRSGSIQSMKSTERSVAEFEQICGRLRLFSGISRSRKREQHYEGVPRDGVGRWTRFARLITREIFDTADGFAKFVVASIRFLVRPWGLLFLAASVTTVYPDAIPDALETVGKFLGDVPWTNQYVTNIAAIVGVFVAVGIVILKGFLSDRVSARRHVQEARNRQALESIVPLCAPLTTISYRGMMELESVCRQVKWQLEDAERWINRKVKPGEFARDDQEHLSCDSDCPERYKQSAEPGRTYRSIELAESFEKLDQVCEKQNPLDTWTRELGRLCSYREQSTMFWLKYKSSLRESVEGGLFFLVEGRVKRIRIDWQHGSSAMLASAAPGRSREYISNERKQNLEQLAEDYRDLMWETLRHLRLCEEMADIAWRANGPRADLWAKFGK